MLSLSLLRSSLMAAGAFVACVSQEYTLGALFGAALVPQLLLWLKGRHRPAARLAPKAPASTESSVPAPGPIPTAISAPVTAGAELDLAALSHELKAPLVGILGLTRILTEGDLDPEQRGLAAGILRSTKNLSGLLDRLLEGASASAPAAIRLARESVDLLRLRDDLVAPMRAAFEAPNVWLRSEVRLGGHRFLMGDAVRLQQIGNNLLTNALKFTLRGEVVLRLTVTQGTDSPVLRLQVADTGIGIAPHRLAAVLGRFEQEHPGIHGQFGGSGLGLSIVKDLTAAMGGELTVTSTVDLGTTFTAEIPMGVQAEPKRQNMAIHAGNAGPNHPVLA